MDFLKLFYRVVGIDLSCCQVFMSQKFLDGNQAGPLVQEMCGKSVTQHVGTFLLQGRHTFKHMMYLIIYKGWCHLLPFIVEQETLCLVCEGGIAHGLVLGYQRYHLFR